jgi:hypothetical protein
LSTARRRSSDSRAVVLLDDEAPRAFMCSPFKSPIAAARMIRLAWRQVEHGRWR